MVELRISNNEAERIIGIFKKKEVISKADHTTGTRIFLL